MGFLMLFHKWGVTRGFDDGGRIIEPFDWKIASWKKTHGSHSGNKPTLGKLRQ